MNKKIFLCVILSMVIFVSLISAQDLSTEKMSGIEFDNIDVAYAIDGYMTGPSGDSEYFIFGAVRFHKPGAPETEWTNPIFYFEFGDEAILAGTARYHYFLEERSDGTLEHLPILRELWSTSGGFELDFVFTKSGEIDISKSSMSIVPVQYKTGRDITQLTWTGEYYKKENKTERFVPRRDDEDKVVNQDEAGEPIIEEINVHVLDVCYEEIIGRNIYYLKANLGNLTYSNSTGLCPVYKVESISRSVGLPDAYELGLIKSEATPPLPIPEVQGESEFQEPEKSQQSAPSPSNVTVQDEEAKESQPSSESEYITPVVVSPPTGESLQVIHPPSNKSK